MKIILKLISVIAVMIVLTNSAVYGQSCSRVKNKCTGGCDPLWIGGQNPTPAIGQYDCYKDGNGNHFTCKCSLIVPAPQGCTGLITCKDSITTCPNLYRTQSDAMTGSNPIAGSCRNDKTG